MMINFNLNLMKKLSMLICFFIFSLSLSSFAQEGPTLSSIPVFVEYNIEGFLTSYSDDISKSGDPYQNFSGSPFVLNEFTRGYIYSGKTKSIYKVDLNFNALSNRVEIMNNDQRYEIPSYAFDSIIVNEQKYIPVSKSEKEKLSFLTMEVLAEDKAGNFLLKNHVVKFIEEQEARPYKDMVPAHFKTFPSQYYFYTAERKLIYLKKLKNLSKYEGFPAEVDDYVKKNKISKKDENSLIQLFSFMFE